MRAAYDLFAGEGAEGGADPEAQLARVAELGPADEFYSLLYRGLYREAKGDANGAKAFMTEVRRVPQLNSLHPVLKYPITTQLVTITDQSLTPDKRRRRVRTARAAAITWRRWPKCTASAGAGRCDESAARINLNNTRPWVCIRCNNSANNLQRETLNDHFSP